MTVAGVTGNPVSGVGADRDEDVVDDGRERRQGHLPLEPQRQVAGDGQEEEEQRPDGLRADLIAPRRPDVVDADVDGLGVGVLRQGVADLLLLLDRGPAGFDPDGVGRAAEDLDARVDEPGGLHCVPGAVAGGPLVVDLDLPGRPALELDAQVEAPEAEGGQTDEDEDPGDGEPLLLRPDEVVVRPLVEDVGELLAQFHAVASFTPSPEAMPSHLALPNVCLRPMMLTSGCMKK